jgi:hypothetical protein
MWNDLVGVAPKVRHYGLSEDVCPEAYQDWLSNCLPFGRQPPAGG